MTLLSGLSAFNNENIKEIVEDKSHSDAEHSQTQQSQASISDAETVPTFMGLADSSAKSSNGDVAITTQSVLENAVLVDQSSDDAVPDPHVAVSPVNIDPTTATEELP
jgi:hypothetical protein